MPIRRTFIQQGTQSAPKPGPLARIVRNGDERGLDLYLLMRAMATGAPFDAIRPAGMWARALNLRGPSAEAAISRTWRRLEQDYRLITRRRSGSMVSIRPLLEDGSGAPYEVPEGRRDVYLRLPAEYWSGEARWYMKLDLPAKALLLISLSLSPGFPLPYDRVPKWYGISASTAERGLVELVRVGILKFKEGYRVEPLSATGYSIERRYSLQGAFRLSRRPAGEVASA